MAIDIGNAATDRANTLAAAQTIIDLANPANASGKLKSVEIWAATNLTGVKVGTFHGTAPTLTNRDGHFIGNVTAGSKQTFAVDIDVITGDYIGIYFATGTLEAATSGGSGVYTLASDQFGTGAQTYTADSGGNDIASVYASGEDDLVNLTIDKIRIDLHDTDAAAERWTDTVLERHIARALSDISQSMPNEQKTTLTTIASRDIDASALADLITVQRVEYPAGNWPPTCVRFQYWANTITLHSDAQPAAGEDAIAYWTQRHALTTSTTTLSTAQLDLLALGATAYAALEWANYAINRVNLGGDQTQAQYLTWAKDRLAAFHAELRRLGTNNALRQRTLYTPSDPPASQTTDPGP